MNDPTATEQIITALVTGFGNAADAMTDGIVSIIPVAIPVLAGFLTLAFCIKVFRKLTGRA